MIFPSLSNLLHLVGQSLCTPIFAYMCMLSHFSCVWLFVTLHTVAHQACLSMGFSRQECWSRLPFPPPVDLPDLGIDNLYESGQYWRSWLFEFIYRASSDYGKSSLYGPPWMKWSLALTSWPKYSNWSLRRPDCQRMSLWLHAWFSDSDWTCS